MEKYRLVIFLFRTRMMELILKNNGLFFKIPGYKETSYGHKLLLSSEDYINKYASIVRTKLLELFCWYEIAD
jgi:hypothetical protein